MRTPRNDPLAADIADGGGEGQREDAGPERRCILTGRHGSRDELVRLALAPPGSDGVCDVLPDPLARAPGRGAWIAVDRPTLAAAQANGKLTGALVRAFKGTRPRLPEDLAGMVEDALRRALLQRLGLAMRAGHLILGSDRIEHDARMGRVRALYHASDAGEDGSRRLDQALRVGRGAEGTQLGGERLPLDRAALSVALGRDNVVHLALAEATTAQRIEGPLRRLLNFIDTGPDRDRASGGGERDTRDLAHAAGPASPATTGS
jgi:predicted RNA-binding protein YlxR (DUF448 family)